MAEKNIPPIQLFLVGWATPRSFFFLVQMMKNCHIERNLSSYYCQTRIVSRRLEQLGEGTRYISMERHLYIIMTMSKVFLWSWRRQDSRTHFVIEIKCVNSIQLRLDSCPKDRLLNAFRCIIIFLYEKYNSILRALKEVWLKHIRIFWLQLRDFCT